MGRARPAPAADPLTPAYEPEPPQRRWLASVQTAPEAWWAAALTVPEDGSGLALLALRRHGRPAGADDGGVTLTLPAAELPAVAALLAGLAADATAAGE